MRYRDRRDAGVELAAELKRRLGVIDAGTSVVLGVPRGGVVVAAAVADALGLPLDIALAAKLGAPHNRELAIGAVGSGDAVWLNDEMIQRLRVSDEWVAAEVQRGRNEIAMRRSYYGRAGDPSAWTGHDVVVVDDGIATGATLAVVLHALAVTGPRRLICAVPVAPGSSIDLIGGICDEVVCPLVPKRFSAVGSWYRQFGQISHDEVTALLGGEADR